jgi:hypothetical protein
MLSTDGSNFLGHGFQTPHISPLITFPGDVGHRWLVTDHLTVPPPLGLSWEKAVCSSGQSIALPAWSMTSTSQRQADV